MALDAFVQGGSSTVNKANVDANFNLQVNPPTNPALAGFAVLAGELNDGSAFGSREVIPYEVSEDGRLGVGLDSVIFNDSFNYAAQNTGNYRYPTATQTVTHASGYVALNGGSVTTINTNCAIQTYRSFPIFGGFGLELKISALHTVAPQANAVTEWGLFQATLPGAAIPSDGVYFRFNAAGEFRCIINYNGTEAQSAALAVPAANVNHSYEMFIGEETVIFFVDGTIVYDVDTPDAFAQPYASGCQPFTARHYIAGSAPSSAMQFKIGALDINLQDMNTTKPWAHVMAAQGLMGYQGQNGGTMGSSALYTNSLAPGVGAAMTNTTAALGSGLGGQFSALPTLAANTDGIVSSFQVPVGSSTVSARTLVITGLTIDAIVSTVLVGGPLLYLYSLAFGHTAVSLATAEAATTKAARRIALGIQSFAAAAAAGTLASGGRLSVHFDAPVVVNSGEFVQVVAKNVGTVTTTGVVTFVIAFDSYYE